MTATHTQLRRRETSVGAPRACWEGKTLPKRPHPAIAAAQRATTHVCTQT